MFGRTVFGVKIFYVMICNLFSVLGQYFGFTSTEFIVDSVKWL